MSSVDLQVTLLGLWGIPFLFATSMHFYKLMAGHILWTIGLVCNYLVLLSCDRQLRIAQVWVHHLQSHAPAAARQDPSFSILFFLLRT